MISDHWDIPIQGGVCRVVEKNGRAVALEIVFSHQPLTYAPYIEELANGPVKMSITGRDDRVIFLKRQLEAAMAFLHCYFDIDLATNEIDAKYEGETPEEEEQISVKSMCSSRYKPPLFLTFDMLTRAIMAAENADGPRFEATLLSTARKALSEQQFINSFRYSFLLIECLYGEGQFRSLGLKNALKANKEFVAIVEAALKDQIQPKAEHASDTLTLLLGAPSTEDVIDHIVDKRGFYFHGNVKRKDAWKPEEQGAAGALALFTIVVAQSIAQQAAAPMFKEAFTARHCEDARNSGAEVMVHISFKFRQPEENFSRENQLNVKMQGTKVTARMSIVAAQQLFQFLEHNLPTAALENATCNVLGSGERVFDMQFHVKK